MAADEVFDFGEELGGVAEAAVDGGEAQESDFVELFELVHDLAADDGGRDFAFVLGFDFVEDVVDEHVHLGIGDGAFDGGVADGWIAMPPGWVHLPRGIEAEWVKQLVAEQLRTTKDRRGFARQEWAKLRERNEALDCAVLARAALWLLGADRYGERFWQQLRDQIADAPLRPSELPAAGNVAHPPPPPQAELATPATAPSAYRPRGWLAPRQGWLR